MMPEKARYQLLKYLEANPTASQRQLARELDISLGKVNYCLKALIGKGCLIKASNFTASPSKCAYAYFLTPKGMEAKSALTIQFLKRKLKEYKELEREIEELRQEASITVCASDR